jgi:hypothetical protein
MRELMAGEIPIRRARLLREMAKPVQILHTKLNFDNLTIISPAVK